MGVNEEVSLNGMYRKDNKRLRKWSKETTILMTISDEKMGGGSEEF